MKICLVTRVVPSHRPGGMPFVCYDRACALAAAGHEVHVLTTNGQTVPVPGVYFHHLNCVPEEWTREFAEQCEAETRRIAPDVLHFDSFDRRYPWWRDSSVKRIAITLHGFGFGAFLTKWNMHGRSTKFDPADLEAEAKALRDFDVQIGISRHEHWMLRSCYHQRNAKLVYNPIPAYFFTDHREEGQRSGFICAAVSGHGPRNFSTAEDVVKSAGHELKIVKNLPRREMPAVYDRAKAVLLPTRYAQGYDLAVAEALARGCPVIATDVGSYSRESEDQPWIRTFPLDAWDVMALMLSEDMPSVDSNAADRHRPEVHAEKWLEAVA